MGSKHIDAEELEELYQKALVLHAVEGNEYGNPHKYVALPGPQETYTYHRLESMSDDPLPQIVADKEGSSPPWDAEIVYIGVNLGEGPMALGMVG